MNDKLEGLLVSTYTAAIWFPILQTLFASLLCSTAVVFLFPRVGESRSWSDILKTYFARHRLGGWIWRFFIASIVFMPIYFIFGLLVLPFVAGYYQQNQFGLQAPEARQVLTILLLRSVLFLLACLPIILSWEGARRSLFFRLGFALFVLVAFPSIFTAYWLPTSLRLPHGLEILADEFAYAGVFCGLLAQRDTAIRPND